MVPQRGTKAQKHFINLFCAFLWLLALEVRTNVLHHVADLRLRHLVFEGRHRFFAVRDHLGDLIVGVFDCVV